MNVAAYVVAACVVGALHRLQLELPRLALPPGSKSSLFEIGLGALDDARLHLVGRGGGEGGLASSSEAKSQARLRASPRRCRPRTRWAGWISAAVGSSAGPRQSASPTRTASPVARGGRRRRHDRHGLGRRVDARILGAAARVASAVSSRRGVRRRVGLGVDRRGCRLRCSAPSRLRVAVQRRAVGSVALPERVARRRLRRGRGRRRVRRVGRRPPVVAAARRCQTEGEQEQDGRRAGERNDACAALPGARGATPGRLTPCARARARSASARSRAGRRPRRGRRSRRSARSRPC